MLELFAQTRFDVVAHVAFIICGVSDIFDHNGGWEWPIWAMLIDFVSDPGVDFVTILAELNSIIQHERGFSHGRAEI